jgi:precorrin-6B methylase 2
MMSSRYARRLLMVVMAVVLAHGAAFAQATATKPFEPTVGQAGKDVVWVPTPQALVEKMLDMAKLTPQDFHMDLGSGDGRTVITAAKRGARSEGIEYNPDMVALSQRNAKEAGVGDKAIFRRADIFETDFSKAQVITLFLLPQLNLKLRPAILNMRPGTRIVSNTFTMDDWTADQTETVGGDCVSWCTAHLWIVPAKVQGTWDVPGRGTLTLTQNFQMISGTLGSAQVSAGKLRGDEITFTAGGTNYTGKVDGNTMTLSAGGTKLTATKK